jgi:phage shock protein C
MTTTFDSSRTLYRSRQGLFFGVCRGIADYATINVFWVRLAVVIATLLTAFWPMVLVYIVAAIFMRPAPVVSFSNEEDWSFYQTYVSNREMALQRLKRRLQALDKRTRRMENHVTRKEYDWDQRFDSNT